MSDDLIPDFISEGSADSLERAIASATKAVRRSVRDINIAAETIEMELVKFRADDGEIDLNFDFNSDTVWATYGQMAALFGCTEANVIQHVTALYESGEVAREATTKNILVVREEGKRTVRRGIEHFNLDMILAVGFKVSSAKAIQFRQFATRTLKAYITDGYALNERRLANDPNALRKLAAEVRRLRSDELQIYQAVRDCFKISATDYDPSSQATRSFYAALQDKFLFAVTGKTAAEIILDRANGFQPNMGLQTISGKLPKLQDAKIGKNYLCSDELYILHILCEQFLLDAELTAIRGQRLSMAQLAAKLNKLLTQNEYPVFQGYGTYLKDRAMDHAHQEFELFKERLAKGETLPVASIRPKQLPNRRGRIDLQAPA